MQIELKIGQKSVVMRGNDDGTVDLCQWVNYERSGVVVPTLVPYKFFSSLPVCLMRVFEMKVCKSDSTTLKQLSESIEAERVWLHNALKGNIE